MGVKLHKNDLIQTPHKKSILHRAGEWLSKVLAFSRLGLKPLLCSLPNLGRLTSVNLLSPSVQWECSVYYSKAWESEPQIHTKCWHGRVIGFQHLPEMAEFFSRAKCLLVIDLRKWKKYCFDFSVSIF